MLRPHGRSTEHGEYAISSNGAMLMAGIRPSAK
jgi:hypothetical protein